MRAGRSHIVGSELLRAKRGKRMRWAGQPGQLKERKTTVEGLPLYSVTYSGWSEHTLAVAGGGGEAATGLRNGVRVLDANSLHDCSSSPELDTGSSQVRCLLRTPWAHELALALGNCPARARAHPPSDHLLLHATHALPSDIRSLALHSPVEGSDLLLLGCNDGAVAAFTWPSLEYVSSICPVSASPVTSIAACPPALNLAVATVEKRADGDGCDIVLIRLASSFAQSAAAASAADAALECNGNGDGSASHASASTDASATDALSVVQNFSLLHPQRESEKQSSRILRHCCVLDGTAERIVIAASLVSSSGDKKRAHSSSVVRATLPAAGKGDSASLQRKQQVFASAAVSSMAASSSKLRIACGSSEGAILVLRSSDLAPLARLEQAHMLPVTSLAFKPGTDATDLASVSLAGTVHVVDTAPLERKGRLLHAMLLGSAAALLCIVLHSLFRPFMHP